MGWLEQPGVETLVLVADQDETTPAGDILDRYQAVRVIELQSDRLLPLAAPEALVAAISDRP